MAKGGDRVHCPFCRNPDSRVIDSRTADDGTAIRRRRACPECGRRFTTQETVILMVAKRSGVTEPFTRDKIIRGVQRACQGRPVSEDKLAILAQQVEETIRARGLAEVPSHEVGLAILGPLRALDEVAYLRFASVYRGFESIPDFWSVNAANIVTSKYFRGAVGSPQREWSLKQLVDRVVGVYTETGRKHGYFATEDDARIFDHELKYALVHQIFSFNSPVWFNVGTSSKAQVSACFILSVDDTMDAILDWYREE